MPTFAVVSTSEHEFVVKAENRDAAANIVRDLLEEVQQSALLAVTINEVSEVTSR